VPGATTAAVLKVELNCAVLKVESNYGWAGSGFDSRSDACPNFGPWSGACRWLTSNGRSSAGLHWIELKVGSLEC